MSDPSTPVEAAGADNEPEPAPYSHESPREAPSQAASADPGDVEVAIRRRLSSKASSRHEVSVVGADDGLRDRFTEFIQSSDDEPDDDEAPQDGEERASRGRKAPQRAAAASRVHCRCPAGVTPASVASQLLPPLVWVPKYIKGGWKEDLKGDVISALTVGCMLVPQSMAYALLAGVPPLYGLYASVVPLLVFPLFSTSRVQAAGPTALDSLLTFSTMGAILSAEQLDDPATTVALAVVLAFVTGILQLIMGALRLGVLVNFLSYSVMSGFTSAAAFIIGFSQLKHIFGITEVPRYTGSFRDIRTFGNVVSRLGETNGWTFFMSSVCVVILLCMRHWKKNVYNKDTATSRQRTLKMVVDFSALVIAVLGVIWAVIYNAAGIVVRSASDKSPLPGNATQFVDVVGDVPSGLPPFAVPDISRFSDRGSDLIFGCSIIALVAFMELYAIARVYAEQRRYPLDANQELVAMGAANVFGSLFQAYPAGGSFSRTAVNANAGANTLLSCLLQGILVALALVAIAPSFFFIPMGALAAIVEVSIINLVKINDFKEAWRLHKWGDLAVMSLTFSVTLCFGIQEGIGLGVLLSIIVTMKHSAFPNVVELGQLPDRLVFRDVNEAEDALQFDAVSIVRIDAELYFANTNYFRGHVMRRTRDHHVIVIDCSVVTELDLQAVHMLNDLLDDVRERKVRLMFAQMRARVRRIFQRSGLSEKIGEENMFIDLSDAVTHAAEAVEEIERRKAAGASSKARGSKPVSSRDLMKSWKERKATPGGSGSDSKAGGGTPSVPEESSAGNSDNEDGAEGDAGGVAAAAVAESHESAQEEAKA